MSSQNKKMSSFTIGSRNIASKGFHKQKQVADIFTIHVNNVIVFDSVRQ